ncbi:MAG: putative toxin-antitoxin system toxin component, PIN family [Burkholderiales bacterium]
MRVVLDTNTIVSGVISPGGPPRRLLDGVRTQSFELCSSATLLAELLDVLSRDKFARRLRAADSTAQSVVAELRRLAYLVAPLTVPHVIEQDADDDHVLACALAGQVNLIVSGDRHLLGLGGHYQGIPIVNAAQAVQRIGGIHSSLTP